MMNMPDTREQRTRAHSRGVAMLLVMIALVVCMVLVTGFLAGQGTANGIARNEMEYIKAQRAAETGAKLCMAEIRNKSGWRNTMTPGTWLNNVTVGDATVTVTAADSAGSGSFATDPTKGVVLTSVGKYNGRTATLVATIQPTGGGTVFYGGSFITGAITMDATTRMDSFNSSNGPYSLVSNVSYNAGLGTATTQAGGLALKDSAALYGTVQLSSTGLAATVVSTQATTTGPTSVTTAPEVRTPGEVIPPNMVGLTSRAATGYTGYNITGPSSGVYSSMTITQAGGLGTNILLNSATVRVTGNMSVASGAKLTAQSNQNVVFYVDGNVSWNGILLLQNNSSVTFYYGGSFTGTSAQMNYNAGAGGVPANLTIMALKNSGALTLKSSSYVYGTIFAPQSDLVLQDNAQLFGGAVGRSLVVTNSAKLHWDTALQTKTLSNVTAGSASPGTAKYTVTYHWNPGGE